MSRISLSIKKFFYLPIFRDSRFLLFLWILLPLISWLMKLAPNKLNNYLIFRESFWHALSHLPLYNFYPAEYHDIFLYGPFFTFLIAPISIMPVLLGHFVWLMVLSLTLYWAIQSFGISHGKQIFILWFCAHELLTALYMSQFNIAIATLILGAFVLIKKDKEWAATLCIVIGTFVKLYGIVGLAFFLFSKNKKNFILWLCLWSVVAFIAPMLFTSPEYIIEQYKEWFLTIQKENSDDLTSILPSISVLGLFRSILHNFSYSDIWVMLGGVILFSLPFLKFKQYKNIAFQQTILASILMFVILFSSGAESSTYIIPFVGVSIWYIAAPWKRSKLDIGLMIFAFILTSLSPSDLFPSWLYTNFVRPYALKSLPCFIIWLKLIYELCKRDYAPISIQSSNNQQSS